MDKGMQMDVSPTSCIAISKQVKRLLACDRARRLPGR